MAGAGLDLYAGTTGGSKAINQTSTLAQKISITVTGGSDAHRSATDGPLSYMELHLTKGGNAESRIEVSIFSGVAYTGQVITKETIIVSKIDPLETNYKY